MLVHARGLCRSIGTLVLFLSVLATGRAQGFGGGTGEPNDPYQIATAQQLVSIGSDPNLLDKHFALIADIDLDPNLPGGRVFTGAVIAPDTNDASDLFQGTSFTGRFDGKGHTIRNLTIRSGGSFLGLFGSIGRGGQVRNLHVKDAFIGGADSCRCLGVLAGYIEQCTVVNCSVTGRVTGGNFARSVGGFAGFVWFDGRILQCSASCNISAGDLSMDIGGMAGANGGEITRCYATGTVSSGYGSSHLGGLVGRNSPEVLYAPGSYVSSTGYILQCYSVARVMGGHVSVGVGGLVGEQDNHYLPAVGSFWDIQASGVSTSAGGTGLGTAEMQDTKTYLAAGWDFTGERANGTADLWLVPKGGEYPVLTTLSEALPAHSLSGTGTADDPYRIKTPEDLGAILHYRDSACFRLTNNIALSGILWSTAPIGVLNGRFDGAGCVVSNLRIRGRCYLGLFDSLGAHASVINLRIVNAEIASDRPSMNIGILTGKSEGLISGCQVSGNVIGEHRVAGLVGLNEKNGRITDSRATGTVTGTGRSHDIAGGLAGINWGTITNSCASVELAGGEYDTLGGLVGDNGGSISGCYATGRIKGNDDLGGLVGWNAGTISNSYAAVDIQCQEMDLGMGGLVGVNVATVVNSYSVSTILDKFNTPPLGGLTGWQSYAKCVVVNSFWDRQATGITESWGGGTGLATAQMQTAATFLGAGWDFDKIWMICEGRDYPRLRWEGGQCPP
jgi:hypothetical protein